jgi:uncharacterized protein
MSGSGDNVVELTDQGIFLNIGLTPKAGANRIEGCATGPDGPILKVRVTAVPEKGKANKALIKLLSKETSLASGRFEIVGGTTSRRKRILIHGGDKALFRHLVAWTLSLSS